MSQLLAVLVGCDYEGASRPGVPELRGAENDAEDMAALLSGERIPNGSLRTLSMLLGSEATTERILSTLHSIISTSQQQAQEAQEAEGSTVEEVSLLFYFAGHGKRDDAGLTLYTWDSELPAGDLINLFDQSPYPTYMVLDCCHAGAIGLTKPPRPSGKGRRTPRKERRIP